ncbi:MAG: AAA family ATPase, partial [Syntrophales bacterium]|nr:AAA family ATPase [Syntrophales bacterium]
MRPLFLSFSGINSYASKAEIDFSHFLKDKIFGIFGETGAGKSTIIDAITYALFGRIDRAGNAINISINPKAKRLFVSFTFKTGSNVFKIVRTKTEKKTEATLYHVVDDKDMPIAEKDREVNEKISKIIGGFTYDEFTKIIALPQNKFSEFLTAKPADRASLLEKIFGLEIFGERLWEKLTERSKINSLELNNINTNLEQLRDVSEEQLFKKASRIKEIEAKIDEATKTLKEKEDRLSELKDLYRLQKNKEIVERNIKILLRHERDMENTRERLKNAEKVAPFRRDFANIDYWQKEIERSFHFIETAIKEVENINNSLSKLKEEEKTFEEEKTKREKEIAVTLKSVDEAIELKKKITDTEKDKTEKEMTLNNIKTQLAEKVKNVTALTENRKILEKRRDALKDEAKEIALSDHEYNLLNTLSTIEKHMGMLKEIEANITEERQNLSSLTSSMDLEKKNLFEIWKTFLPETPLNTPETADDELISIKNDIQTRIDKITSKIHKLELAESASFLAIELKEGEPCPVCGSKTHPAPAVKPPSDEILTWKKRLD